MTWTTCWSRPARARRAVVIGGGLLGLEARERLWRSSGMRRHRGASARHAHGPAARRGGRGTLLRESLRGARHRLPPGGEHARLRGRGPCQRVRLEDGARTGGRPGGHGGGYHAPHRAGAAPAPWPATAASWSTTRCRPTIRPSTRSANACSIAADLRAGGAAVGAGAGLCACTWPSVGVSRYRGSRPVSPAQDQRHRGIFRGRPGAAGRRANRSCYADHAAGVYKRLWLEDNKVCGAVLFGDAREPPRYAT